MRVWAAGRFPSRLRCPRAANFRGCGWHAGHGRTPARRGTGVAGWPRSTVSTAIPHTPAQSFARATGWRVGDQRRLQNGRCACVQPLWMLPCDHVAAGAPDPSACVYVRKCTMVCGANAAVFVLCGSLVVSAEQAQDQIAGASLFCVIFGVSLCAHCIFPRSHSSITPLVQGCVLYIMLMQFDLQR